MYLLVDEAQHDEQHVGSTSTSYEVPIFCNVRSGCQAWPESEYKPYRNERKVSR
jgi:hypothetical protein